MIKKVLFSLSLVSLVAMQANAQRINPCGTDEVYRQQLAAHPEIAAVNEQLSKEIYEKLNKMDISRYAKTTDDGTIEYKVPLVFHVIHDYGNEYVTDAAIAACVAKINTMFNKRNADTADVIFPFKGFIQNSSTRYIGNARITWYLPTKDPSGNPTNGITRRRSYLTRSGSDLAKYDQWPPQNYMNIWLITKMAARHSNAAAYAYKPATGAIIPYYDGIIGLYTYLNESDYTFSHELGHELNLDHVWGGTNEPNVACGDDDVDDTPPTLGHVTTGGCTPAKLFDTKCLITKSIDLGKLRLDSTLRADGTILIFSDTSTSKGIEFGCRTTCTIDSVSFFPSAPVGSIYKIGLTRNGVLIDSVSITTTVTTTATERKEQIVPYIFKITAAPKSTIFKMYFMENPGAWRDTLASSTFPKGRNGGVLISKFATGNYYDFFYAWKSTMGNFKMYGDSLVDYPDTSNAQNVMDYTYCSKMFTHGQTLRMRAALTSSIANRDSLITASNLERTGFGVTPNLAPKAEFSVEKGIVTFYGDPAYFLCADMSGVATPSFSFRNRTWQANATNIDWTFSNGATVGATSTSVGTIITKFATPGWASVSMKATNANGNSSFELMPKVYVADPTARNPIGLVQDFNDEAENAKWPILNYYNNRYKWEMVKDGGGTYDGTAIRYRSYDNRVYPDVTNGEAAGDYDDFFTPAYDLSGLGDNGNINFMYAGAYATVDPTYMKDSFEVAYSSDCGASWQSISTMKNAELQTVGTVTVKEYVPGWADWKLKSIDLKSPSGVKVRDSRVFFRFRYRPSSRPAGGYYLASGNNFYIDRIHVSNNPLTVNEVAMGDKTVAIAPNPTSSNAFVLFKKPNANVKIDVLDITGKLVYTTTQKIDQSNAKVEIPASAISVKGVYMVHIVGEDNLIQTEKLISY